MQAVYSNFDIPERVLEAVAGQRPARISRLVAVKPASRTVTLYVPRLFARTE